MPRTVYVIPAEAEVDDAVLAAAAEAGATEIALGVPAAFAEDLDGVELPTVHVEFDPPRPDAESDTAAEPATETGEAAMRRDVDLLLQLVLTSQDGEANDVASLAPTLRGMAERASLTTAVVDGAFGWGVITSDERAELLEQSSEPGPAGEDDVT